MDRQSGAMKHTRGGTLSNHPNQMKDLINLFGNLSNKPVSQPIPSHFIGIHVFSILPASGRDRPKYMQALQDDMVIYLVNRSGAIKSFGPIMSESQVKEIIHLIGNTDIPKIGYDILWQALDIRRRFPRMPFLKPLLDMHIMTLDFPHTPVYKKVCIREAHRKGPQMMRHLWKVVSKAQNDTTCTYIRHIHDVASVTGHALLDAYAKNLFIWRLKWEECQDVRVEMKNYDLAFASKPKQSDENDTQMSQATDDWSSSDSEVDDDTPFTEFTLEQRDWESHIMPGTKLRFIDSNGEEHKCADVHVKDNYTTVTFSVPIEIQSLELVKLVVVRGNEEPHLIKQHIRLAELLLLNPSNDIDTCRRQAALKSRGLQFCTDELHLNKLISTHAMYVIRARGDSIQPSAPKLTRAARRLQEKRLRWWTRDVKRDLTTPLYDSLNSEQQRSAESTACLGKCTGYPGSGKTSSLVGLVLKRFEHLLTQRNGWILCVAQTNSSVLHMVDKLSKFPSLHPHIKHAFSKGYKAFHPTAFVHAYPYRVTPKMKLMSHGIMVCTIGRLPRVLEKFPLLQKVVMDLVTDESGLIWTWDSLLILSNLHNLQRWNMFGDQRQMCPKLTRLVMLGTYFPSIMVMNQSDMSHVFLCIQYRMIPVICAAHAMVFYDYEVISFRQKLCNPPHDGIFLDRMPTLSEGGYASLEQYEIKRVLHMIRHIQGLQLKTESGHPYGICVLSPFKRTVEAVTTALRNTLIKQASVHVATIDTIQGCESDVVIIATSKQSLHGLLSCKYRANVATSRARNMLIILATSNLLLDTGRSESLILSRANPWGLIASYAKPWNPDDEQTSHLIFQLQQRRRRIAKYIGTNSNLSGHTEPRSKLQSKSNKRLTKTNKFMEQARDLLLSPVTGNDRKQACRELILKQKDSLNQDHQRILFAHMISCDDDTYRKALQLFATVYNYTERNTKLRTLFNYSRSDVASQDVRQLVANLYKYK